MNRQSRREKTIRESQGRFHRASKLAFKGEKKFDSKT